MDKIKWIFNVDFIKYECIPFVILLVFLVISFILLFVFVRIELNKKELGESGRNGKKDR